MVEKIVEEVKDKNLVVQLLAVPAIVTTGAVGKGVDTVSDVLGIDTN
jgi:hypothetical protein